MIAIDKNILRRNPCILAPPEMPSAITRVIILTKTPAIPKVTRLNGSASSEKRGLRNVFITAKIKARNNSEGTPPFTPLKIAENTKITAEYVKNL
ncbi:MAG: hypothetical protein Q8865_04365 [Bacillota bacterium]|nr:hypothetical protein [Bacillota bacterium]